MVVAMAEEHPQTLYIKVPARYIQQQTLDRGQVVRASPPGQRARLTPSRRGAASSSRDLPGGFRAGAAALNGVNLPGGFVASHLPTGSMAGELLPFFSFFFILVYNVFWVFLSSCQRIMCLFFFLYHDDEAITGLSVPTPVKFA